MTHSSEFSWRNSPSQLIYVFRYVVYLAAIYVLMFEAARLLGAFSVDLALLYSPYKHYFALAVVAKAVWDFLVLHNTLYEIRDSLLCVRTGVLNQEWEKLEIFRIKDLTVKKPLALRVFGLGNVSIVSSDETTPVVTLQGISDPNALVASLTAVVRLARRENGVREFD